MIKSANFPRGTKSFLLTMTTFHVTGPDEAKSLAGKLNDLPANDSIFCQHVQIARNFYP